MLGRILSNVRKANRSHQRTSKQQYEFTGSLEHLEQRMMLTTTIFFDFGAGFAAGGLNTTAGAYRDFTGFANTGTNMTNGTTTNPVGMAAGDAINIQRLNYDFDGNGTPGQVGDANALAAAVMPLVERALEPFDINPVVASSANIAQANAAMSANLFDPTGEFDAYNFVGTFTSGTLVTGGNPTGSLGFSYGLFGRAAARDLNAQVGNNFDEATMTFADVILNSTNGTPGSDQFNQNLATRLAYTATHEAFHTLTYVHTVNLESSGDVIRLGSNTREDPFIVTRFDLNRQGGFPVAEPNNYLQAATDPDIGLRDSDFDGVPDLAYLTGTGAHDLIQLTAVGAGSFMTSVSAFSNTGMTTLIGTETYNVSLLGDTEGTVLVDSSINVDRVEVDASINAAFRLRGGTGLDGTATEADRAVIDVGGADVLVTAFGDGLSFQVQGGASFDISEFEFIDLNNVGSFEILGTNFDDVLNLAGTGNANEVEIDLNGNTLTVQTDALLFTALGGNDQMIVDSSTDLVRLDNGIRYDGGSGFDSLEMTQTGGSQDEEEVVIGATNGSGVDTITGPTGSQVVEFTSLEPFFTNVVANNLFINGGTIGSLLNTSNQITYATSNIFGATWGMVTVDAFEPIHFSNKTNLNIDAENGSDDISLNNPFTPSGLTNINLRGGDPTASDTLIVNGIFGSVDILRHTPIAQGTGTVVNDGASQPTVNFFGIEHLHLVVQEADGDEIRLDGTAGNDRFEFFHGATADSGIFRGTMDENSTGAGPYTLTETTYFGVTTAVQDVDVNFFVAGGTDTFVFNGTSGNDNIQVNDEGATDIEIINTVNNDQVAFLEVFNINSALVRGHNGSDVFDHDGAVEVTTTYEGGNPGTGSDVLNLFGAAGATETVLIEPGTNATEQDITGLGANVLASGVELLTYSGEGDNDTLIVELEDGFKTATLSDGPDGNGPAYDQLTSSVLPTIRYRDIADFEVDNDDLGVITVITDDLNEAANQILVDGDGDETLIIVGNDPQNDDYTLTNDASGNVQIVDNREGVTINTTGIDGPNDRLVVRTGGQDDLLTVDVTGTDLIDVQIEYDGGPGNDLLVVTGNPSVVINNVTYTPGASADAGKLEYNSTGNDMFIEFVGLEPVIDTTVAVNLTVNGTNSDNAITYTGDPADATRGLVAVDGFEVISFNNKVNLNLNGNGGSDIFTIDNPNVPTGLTDINVDGGTGPNDELTVLGTAANDVFTLDANTLDLNGLDINFTSLSSLVAIGRAGDDTFNVRATSLPVRLQGNAGQDVFNVSSNAPLLTGDLSGIQNNLVIDGGGQTNFLNVSDFGSALPNPNVIVDYNAITGLAPANIYFASTGGDFIIDLNGADGPADNFVIQGLLVDDDLTVNGNGGNDRFVLKPQALGDVTLNGNTGDDSFRIELNTAVARTVNVDGGPGTDNLAIFGTDGVDILDLDTNSLTAFNETVNFSMVEAIQVHGLGDNDVFNLDSNNVPVVLKGNGGNDTFNITDDFPLGNLNGINALVTVIGGPGANTLNVSDLTDGPNPNVMIGASQIMGLAPANINYLSAGGTFDITVIGSNLFDNIDVLKLDAANTLEVYANDGNDVLTVRPAVQGEVSLFGEDDNDTFNVFYAGAGNRMINVSGGLGNDQLNVFGTPNADSVVLNNGHVSRDNERVNYNTIENLFVDTRPADDTVHVNAGAEFTHVFASVGDDYVTVHHTDNITDRLIVSGGSGRDDILVEETFVRTQVNGQHGADVISIGSTLADDYGNLDQIRRRVSVNGGSQVDQLYLNDRAAIGMYDYVVTPNRVYPTNAPRLFADVFYNSNVENLRLDGTDQRNEFIVYPSFNTYYFIDGNLPSRNQVNSASEGDFLNLVTAPNDGHLLTLTDRDTGTGRWEFTNGFNTINFTEIEQFNHVERLAVGSDVHQIPGVVKVYDAESRVDLFHIQPYEDWFQGGVRVATGDINGDGIPDIVTAPGHGRVSTIKVFDGWDGMEIQSFVAYGPHMLDGAFVAVGNVTGNSANDIITAADHGTYDSQVRVFRNANHGATFNHVYNIQPYGNHAPYGASVAAGDVNNDGYDDIITAPLNGQVQVAVYAGQLSGAGPELARFRAYQSNFRGGAYVAAGDYLGDGSDDVILGAGHNSYDNVFSSQVLVYDGSTLQNAPGTYVAPDFAFYAYTDSGDQPRAAVRLVGKDHDLDGQLDELFAGQGHHGRSDEIRVFQPLSGAVVDTIAEDFNGLFLG